MADLDLFQNGGALKTRLRASMVAGEAMHVIAPVHCRSYRIIVDVSNLIRMIFSFPLVIQRLGMQLGMWCTSTTNSWCRSIPLSKYSSLLSQSISPEQKRKGRCNISFYSLKNLELDLRPMILSHVGSSPSPSVQLLSCLFYADMSA